MIVLKPFTAADFQQLIDWIDTEELLTSWSGSLFSFPLTIDSMQWYVQDTNMPGQSDAFVFKAVESSTGETAGHISLGSISWKNKSSRISRVFVSTAFRGRGIGKQMINAVLKIGFEELGLHRIALGVYENNKAALNCYLQCGLKIEGISKDILWYKDAYLSMVDMAIMEDEWKALQV
ncbi:MAG: GNAT family N-acetyltransferase [Ferruginibacter sp.]|nr:GNAT family N-acetyltransferase [Bacteroidota bacterium]MBX2918679.1 GNAT family N-acetyltransferase [Ferruginibacter sp.]MCB0709157.1 GNAT family N-acetyltransferase [Chitinophagaceae bacterium]MCC7378781.1 GNAT family N-acetyltransferase [Chitinophagaceae bacterium]